MTTDYEIEIPKEVYDVTDSLKPANIIFNPKGEKFAIENRGWQGVPSITITEKGTLWAAYMSGGKREGTDNYVLCVRSDDGGNTWSDFKIAIDHPGDISAYDVNVWTDPTGKMWLTWSQSTFLDVRYGVWAINTENPDDPSPKWTKPIRIANGDMLNNPTFLASEEWLLPIAVWACTDPKIELNENIKKEMFSNVYSSIDNGKTFKLKGSADVPDRHYDEHKVIEKKDGSLWMLVRTHYGIGQSFSYDKGVTWTKGTPTGIEGPSARFHISRLSSGNLLLVYHEKNSGGRHKLEATISKDDGITWEGHLSIDDRNAVSYPNAVQDKNEIIYIIYDHERYGEGAKEILVAKLMEEDILAGKCVSEIGKLKIIVNRAREEGEK